MTLFIRLIGEPPEKKEDALLASINSRHAVHPEQGGGWTGPAVFDVESTSLAEIPGSPFAYWVGSRVRRIFSSTAPCETAERSVRKGMVTTDDFRFLRNHWEVLAHDFVDERRWVSYAKGGAYAEWYLDIPLYVNWNAMGRELWALYEANRARTGGMIKNPTFYFRPGLTWTPRTQIGFALRLLPSGGIFGNKGPAIFWGDSHGDLLAMCAVGNSCAFRALVATQMAFGSYEVGVIQRTPFPPFSDVSRDILSGLARRAWSLKRLLDTTNETSHAFVLPPGTRGYEALPFHPGAGGFDRAEVHRELAEIQTEIDDNSFTLYGIGDEDRATIEASMAGGTASQSSDDGTAESSDEEDDPEDEEDDATAEVTATTLTTYSWLVGVAFGRFDPRLATGERAIPPEPEPFDPLPARSPGMWPEGEEPPFVTPEIMVDDPGHSDDIRSLVASAAAQTGWPEPEDLRQWLAKEFFPLHIKMYSKSRRKAPIYWQLATPSASYSVWLYIHAFTKDTLFRVQNEYVGPKLAHEQRKLESLQAAAQAGQSAPERKELANQETSVEELRAFLNEVKRVAPLWNPNLDDGVIINFSILWRLVPQNKSWQKDLKATWDALADGKYDWAHLAMHLWPERVVPQCAKDRSLAIAHGLEEVFWVEGADGKWTARKTPTTPITELVRARTSPAVQDALKQLQNAPTAAAGGTKKKAARKTTARRSKSAPPSERAPTKNPPRAKRD